MSIIKVNPEDKDDLLRKLFKYADSYTKYYIAMELNDKELLLKTYKELVKYDIHRHELINVIRKLLLDYDEKSIIPNNKKFDL